MIWHRDGERQMWVCHEARQAVSFVAAQDMGLGDADTFKGQGPLSGRDGQLARVWYQRTYTRDVLMDALLDARSARRSKTRV